VPVVGRDREVDMEMQIWGRNQKMERKREKKDWHLLRGSVLQKDTKPHTRAQRFHVIEKENPKCVTMEGNRTIRLLFPKSGPRNGMIQLAKAESTHVRKAISP